MWWKSESEMESEQTSHLYFSRYANRTALNETHTSKGHFLKELRYLFTKD